MTDDKIKELCIRFRAAVNAAYKDGRFAQDIMTKNFPHGSCDTTSDLLAEYLQGQGVKTIWISAYRDHGNHQWLVVNDKRVKQPSQKLDPLPQEYLSLIGSYAPVDLEQLDNSPRYVFSDLENGLAIDITADQFPDFNEPVFVGKMGRFHKSFDFSEAEEFTGLKMDRLKKLYQIIEEGYL